MNIGNLGVGLATSKRLGYHCPSTYRTLRQNMSSRFCIITEEYSELNRSGGIGACARGLAILLISKGYSVDVLITDQSCNSDILHVKKVVRDGPNFLFLSEIATRDKHVVYHGDAISKAYCVYRFLSEQNYAVVHFNDWFGSGFYCAMARRQGLFNAIVVTHLHGSAEWVRLHNAHSPELEDFEREAIERSQIENSDIVISPSEYLLDWYRGRGLTLPDSKQINWFLPKWIEPSKVWLGGAFETRAVEPGTVSELIFFGRHERRKGFELFVDAVSRLPMSINPDITFIGRFDRIGREFSGSHVFRRLASYGGRIRFFNELDQGEALERIARSRNALCVMPSLIENSPCTVGECFTIGAPFLATDVGGTSELIDVASREHCLVPADAKALAAAIERTIVDGAPTVKSALRPGRISELWNDCARAMNRAAACEPPRPRPSENILVSVCITHYERPQLLREAIAALMAQTYENVEIIVVDDGSRRPDAHAYLSELEAGDHRLPIRVVRSANRYLGAARNLAASHAHGDYLLFHDDDNISEPNELELFVGAALASGCEILTSQYWVFKHGYEAAKQRKIEYFPIGIGGVFSFFRNRFGDANALISRACFERLGGFTELHGVGWEDWEFFLRAYMRGTKMGVVPAPLFNYRVSANGMLATGNVLRNHERLYSLIDEERPRLGSELLRYVQRHDLQQAVLDSIFVVLEQSPAGRLHQELTALDPNSAEARGKLSDLAFALGRAEDAIEIGLSDFYQREKLLGLAAQFLRPQRLNLRGRIFVTLEPGQGKPVVALRGWAFDSQGRAYAPTCFRVERDYYETIVHVRQHRPDVVESFQLPSDVDSGFVVAGRKNGSGFMQCIRRLKPIATSPGVNASLFCSAWERFKGHVDEVFWCREVAVEPPDQNLWHGTILVESQVDGYVFMKKDGGPYAIGNSAPSSRARFSCSPTGCAASKLWFILPSEGRVDIIFE